MPQPFAKKLFRLFLLFSLVPAIVLAVAGYYLTVETGSFTSGDKEPPSKELTTYYNDYLFARIEKILRDNSTDPDDWGAISGLDFLFTEESDHVTAFQGSDLLPRKCAQTIAQQSKNRPRGFVEWNGAIYQYACRSLADDVLLCGGYRHGQKYAELVSTFQTSYALHSSEKKLKSRYTYFLAVIFIALTILMVGLSYLLSARLSRNLARPLAEISNASKEIATGNFTLTVPKSGIQEMQTLIENFNYMAQQLDKTAARLAQSERVAAWRHVARRFAHELKNPLQPILVSLYRIEKTLKDTSEYDKIAEHLQATSVEIKHLKNLADRFSQLAKLPPPKLEKANLNELLSSLANLYREQLAAYNFALRLPLQTVYAQVDVIYFREALHNLLLNAVEASEEGSRIVLALKTNQGSVDITIEDAGHGMTTDVLASARMPYFTTKNKGSGLGLAIVEKTVSEMGGQLFIDSKEGVGTTVTITLPRSK